MTTNNTQNGREELEKRVKTKITEYESKLDKVDSTAECDCVLRERSYEIISLCEAFFMEGLPTEDEILGMVARAYCTEENINKVLDYEVLNAVAKIVSKRLRGEK